MASVRLLGGGGTSGSADGGSGGWSWPTLTPQAPSPTPTAPDWNSQPAPQTTTAQSAGGSAWPTTWSQVQTTADPAPAAGQVSVPGMGDPQAMFSNVAGSLPADRASLERLGQGVLQRYGWQLSPPNASGELTKIYVPGVGWVRVIEGAGANAKWTWVPQGSGESTGSGGGYGSMPGPGSIGDQGVSDILRNYQNQFDDPSTQQLEQLIQAQLKALEEQRGRQAGVDPYFRQQIQGAQQKTAELMAFLQQRAASLQEDPYTGAEWEVLRTRALDPIEADRQAAQQRARGRIGNAGYDPTSGIAQDLLNQVDAGYDRNRAAAQNDLAYRSIAESRSREQEAQSLLGMLPEIQRAGASGDLGLIQALDAALNLPRQQALPLASLQQDLPNRAMQQAMAAMGMGPSPNDLFQQAMQMYQVGQQNQSNWWGSLGQMMPWLFSGMGGGGGATGQGAMAGPGMLGGWGAGSF